MSFWYQKPIPRVLFHGSQYNYLDSIKRGGLRAGTKERANFSDFADDVAGFVSLSDTPIAARRFAVFASKGKTDIVVLVIDSLKAGIHGTKIVPMRGKLSREYGGHEYLAIGNISPEAIVGAYRYHHVNGKFVEEYIKL